MRTTIIIYTDRIHAYCEMADKAERRHRQNLANYKQMKDLGNLVMQRHYSDYAYLYLAMSVRLENRAQQLIKELNHLITRDTSIEITLADSIASKSPASGLIGA